MVNFPNLRSQLERLAGIQPDLSPKRYAPYTVWSRVRFATILAYIAILLGLGLAWLLQSPVPVLLTFLGIIVAVPYRHSSRAFLPEVIGIELGSRYCPACGQSIFSRAPPTGYVSDQKSKTWWPQRFCASCGHDLKVRTVD